MCAHRRYKKERRRFLSAKIGRIDKPCGSGDKNIAKMHDEWYRTPSLETDEGGKIKTPEG